MTLLSLKEALQHPFAPEAIQFLPKDIHQEHGQLVCLALPYANKRVYEDRLNEVAFGEWSTPYTAPYAQDNKLIIPATVVILGVAHTDYGEAFLTATNKNGTTREDENTATEAYSQAFRRACAKFLLGRYLYDLPKLTLPYDPTSKQIAASKAERIAWVEKMYLERGLIKPRGFSTPERQVVASAVPKTIVQDPVSPQPSAQSVTTIVEPGQQNVSASPAVTAKTAPIQQRSTPPVLLQKAAVKESQTPTQPTNYPNDTFLDWVAQQVGRDPERVQGICTFYQVQGLARLSDKQRKELTQRLRQQASHHRQSAATASV